MMKLCTLVFVSLTVILALDVLGQCEGWWGSSKSSSSESNSGSSSEYSHTKSETGRKIKIKGNTVHFGKGPIIRERDETGHRTGLGTLAKKMLTQPVKTVKAGIEMHKNHEKLVDGKVKGGNLEAHEVANREATKKSDAETAAAFSALREHVQYKKVRPQLTKTKDGSFHLDLGDTRTKEETDETMKANKKGRESALEG